MQHFQVAGKFVVIARVRELGTLLVQRNIVNGTPAGETLRPAEDVMISRRTRRGAHVSAVNYDCCERQHVVVLVVFCADACRGIGVPYGFVSALPPRESIRVGRPIVARSS